jgi:hypothetical protein
MTRENKGNLTRKLSLTAATIATVVALYGCGSSSSRKSTTIFYNEPARRARDLEPGRYDAEFKRGHDTILKDTELIRRRRGC